MNRFKRIRFFSVALLLLLLASTAALAAPVEAVDSYINPTYIYNASSSNTYSMGYQFTVNTDILVTSLGYFDYAGDGLAFSHDIGIFLDAGGAALAMATVAAGTSDTLIEGYRYISLAAPLALSAGNTYRIAGTVADNQDAWISNANNIMTDASISYLGSYLQFGAASLVFPVNPSSNSQYLQVNFQLEPVPLPGAAWLFGAGLVGLVGLRKRMKK